MPSHSAAKAKSRRDKPSVKSVPRSKLSKTAKVRKIQAELAQRDILTARPRRGPTISYSEADGSRIHRGD